MGYHIAGFDVVGVDKEPQPNYPFRFYQMDLTTLTRKRARRIRENFDGIHASPPCQAYSTTSSLWPDREHPDLVGFTRDVLNWIGLPWVIENVPGAPLIDPVTVCGSTFGMRLRRHRLFEASFPLIGTECNHGWQNRHRPYTAYNYSNGRVAYPTGVIGVFGGGQGMGQGEVTLWKVAMGIDWMTKEELAQAIPPAYTRWIGKQLLREVMK